MVASTTMSYGLFRLTAVPVPSITPGPGVGDTPEPTRFAVERPQPDGANCASTGGRAAASRRRAIIELHLSEQRRERREGEGCGTDTSFRVVSVRF